MYDYGARNYDPSLGRWMNMDPLAEKYFSKNPYMYCNNNPILYIDPNGMYFTEASRSYVNNYKSGLNKDKNKNNDGITKFLNKIANGGSEGDIKNWTDKINDLKSENDGIDLVLKEIQVLDDSTNQAYHIQEGNMQHGITGFQSGVVVIGIPQNGYSKDVLAHELKHAYQFEIGETSLSQTDDAKSFLYDKTDEIEAYKRGGENYGLNNLPAEYQNLPNGPLNISNNQEIIKALKLPVEQQKQALQNIATKEKSAFRVNGQTYRKY
jgi:hypothetical protein